MNTRQLPCTVPDKEETIGNLPLGVGKALGMQHKISSVHGFCFRMLVLLEEGLRRNTCSATITMVPTRRAAREWKRISKY